MMMFATMWRGTQEDEQAGKIGYWPIRKLELSRIMMNLSYTLLNFCIFEVFQFRIGSTADL